MPTTTIPHRYSSKTGPLSQVLGDGPFSSGVRFGSCNPKPPFLSCPVLGGSVCPFGSDWSVSGGRSCGRCHGSDSSLTTLYTSQTNKRDSLTLIRVKHKDTGQVCVFDGNSRVQHLFQRSARGFNAAVDAFDLEVYFVTLTLGSDVSVALRELNRFLSLLRMRFKRLGLPFFYLWVVELQRKRYLKTGVKALHWHLAIAVPDGCLPDVDFFPDSFPHYRVKREGSVISSVALHGHWGRGQVFCQVAKQSVGRYLAKYLGKSLSEQLIEGDGLSHLRRFGSSQLGAFRYPDWVKDGLDALRSEAIMPIDDLYLRLEGNRLNGYCVVFDVGRAHHKGSPGARYERVLSLRSPWRKVDKFRCRHCGVSEDDVGGVPEVCTAFFPMIGGGAPDNAFK